MSVKDVPNANDFFEAGKGLLDFAWDITAQLLTDLDDIGLFGGNTDHISEEYWKAAKRALTTALATSQQGTEFILKGKIAEVSPYLLLAGTPDKWPSINTGKDVSYSDFRTIDAQDLIKVINTFSDTTLPDDFKNQFDDIRKKRNQIMHSVNKELSVDVVEVISSILKMYKSLFPTESWPKTRLAFIEAGPSSVLDANGFSINRACWEIEIVTDLLKPAQVKKFFGFSKKQRRYFCPNCYYRANRDADFEHRLATLTPNAPKSTKVYCPICDTKHSINRVVCGQHDCKGNVISNDGLCLTCAL